MALLVCAAIGPAAVSDYGMQVSPAARAIRILYPSDGVALAGPLRVIVAAPVAVTLAAALDGKPLVMQRMPFSDTWVTPGRLKATDVAIGDRLATTLWVAEPRTVAGRHVLTIGGQRIAFTLAGAEPGTSPTQFSHRTITTGTAVPDCSGCHEQTARSSALGAARTPDMCAPCHDEAAVQLIHHHIPQPLSSCASCHDPHGAPLPKCLSAVSKRVFSQLQLRSRSNTFWFRALGGS